MLDRQSPPLTMDIKTQVKCPCNIIFVFHRYIGLAIGVLAAAIGLTGSLLIIHGWTSRLRDWLSNLTTPPTTVTPVGERLPLPKLIEIAKQAQPTLTLESLDFPQKLIEPATAWWLAPGDKWSSAAINPYTGILLSAPQAEEDGGETYTQFLYNIHITLMGGEWGGYVAGLVGLLTTILCITGIALWPGWRKLTAGFKIKWNANIKRLNFDLHKVAGIIAAIFLAMAMGTGFIWNFNTWTYPMIYAMTFSPQPVEAAEPTSKPIPNQSPIAITAELLQTASVALPPGDITSIYFPTKPEGVIRINKTIQEQDFTAIVDQYSGQVIKVDNPLEKPKSLGDRITESFYSVHFGTFAGEASRILYVFVGLSPTILLTTGFIMWRHRRKPPQRQPSPPRELTLQ
jgi:uncharacterized iron-regulated membrane protein